jgi:CheY-like chemotaxis protein
VLVVDDEPIVLLNASEMIEQAGWLPLEANNSAEALKVIGKLPAKPVVRDLPVSQTDVKNYLARVGSGSSAQELQRQFLARYRAAKGKSAK